MIVFVSGEAQVLLEVQTQCEVKFLFIFLEQNIIVEIFKLNLIKKVSQIEWLMYLKELHLNKVFNCKY